MILHATAATDSGLLTFFKSIKQTFMSWSTTKEVVGSILLTSLLVNVLSLAFPLALLQVYDRVIPNVAYNTLLILVVGVIAALLVEGLLRIARSYVSAWADAKFEHITGCEAFSKVLHCSLKSYESEGAGIHLKRIGALGMLRDFYAGQFLISFADIPFIILILGLIILIGGYLVFVPVILLAIFVLTSFRYASNTRDLLESRKQQENRQMNFLIEAFGNMHTIKGDTLEAQILRRYERLQRVAAVNHFNININTSRSTSKAVTLSQLTIVLVVAVGSAFVISGHMTIGGLAACTILSGRVMQPIFTLMGVWTRLKGVALAREDLDKVFEYPQETNTKLPAMKKLHGEIELRNLRYSLESDYEAAMYRVNLTIKANEIIGIKPGDSLAASKMLWIIMGLIKAEKGQVLLDGHDINNYQVTSYRPQIAYMQQQCVLFNGTIMENLTMFEVDKYYERAMEIAALLNIAYAIESLPDGYDTLIENQVSESLPHGLSQCIAIGRGLIRDPKIILFDQANMALDMRTDEAVREAMSKLIGKHTIILVSQRPSFLKMASKLYSFQNGVLGVAT